MRFRDYQLEPPAPVSGGHDKRGRRKKGWLTNSSAPLLLLLAAIPLFVANVFNEITIRQIKVSELQAEVTYWVSMVASERKLVFGENVRAIEQLIDSGFVSAGEHSCRSAMVWLGRQLPNYQRLLVVDDRGVVRCSSDPEMMGQSLALHTVFQQAITSSEMIRSPATWYPKSADLENAFAQSFPTVEGGRGVVISLSNSSWLRRMEEVRPLPTGARLYVSDKAGNVVNAAPHTETAVTRLPGYLLPLLQETTDGLKTLLRDDDREMIVRYAQPLDPTDQTTIILSLDRDRAMERIDNATRNAVGISVLILLASFLVASLALARFLHNRERLNRTLRLNEERLRLALEAARAGPFEYNLVTGEVIASRDFYLLMGMPPSDQPSHVNLWWKVIQEEDRVRIEREFEDALKDRKPRSRFEYRVIRPDGSVHWIDSIIRITRNSDGTPVRVSGLCIDTTERKQLEIDLRAATDEAERATVAKSRFLASASHDLRQPMQSLFLFAEALKRHVETAGQEKLAQLVRSLNALKMLLDSLLDVSKLDAGLVEPNVQDFRLVEITADLSAAYSSIAQSRGLSWRVSADDLVVRSDRVLLTRVLHNLLENAMRYTSRGGVELRAIRQADKVRIEVADSGVGIDKEQRKHIFEEFFQVGNPERNRLQGLGLGLPIVRRIADLLGHEIEVISSPGRGSIFTVVVSAGDPARVVTPASEVLPDKDQPYPGPLESWEILETKPADHAVERTGHDMPDQPQADAPVSESGKEITSPPTSQHGLRAMIIDDEVLVLLGMEAILREQGFEVTAASSADQALEKLEALGQVPDVILADYRLANGKFGTEAVAAIREWAKRPVTAFLLTGETAVDTLRAASSNGLTVLNKPITARQLMAALEQVTANRNGPPPSLQN